MSECQGVPRQSRPRGRLSARVLALGIALTSLFASCRVTPPTPKELLAVHFRTPEAAFQAFQTASRGDLPDLEFSCLSTGFRSRNGISKLAYLEFREEWLRSEPLVRYAIDRARVSSVEQLGPDRAVLSATTLGTTLELRLVREEFFELWTAEGLADSRDIEFDGASGEQYGSAGEAWLWARVPLPPALDRSAITEISLLREWRIDDFRLQDSAPPER